MKKFTLLMLVIVFATLLSSCYRVQPNAGQESVLIKQPYFFGHGGVDPVPVSTGSEWVAITTEHKEFAITPVTMTEEFKDMIPADNTPVSFNAYLKLQIIAGKTPELISKFNEKWYENSIEPTFRTAVRDKA